MVITDARYVAKFASHLVSAAGGDAFEPERPGLTGGVGPIGLAAGFCKAVAPSPGDQRAAGD